MVDFKSVGVIGAGTMGVGVTVDLILHNIHVVLVDLTDEILNEARNKIESEVKMAMLFNKSLSRISSKSALEKVHFTKDLKDVSYCDFIVENVFEKWEVKESVYKRLNEICNIHTCFGVNTSCIPITKIASVTNRPQKVIGIHFMNPVSLKNTVEVIKGFHTSQECIEITESFLGVLNKKAIIVDDYPGFVSNRISHLFMNEAAFVVFDQVSDPKKVDEIFKKCYGHAMGPLETADLIGLDTVVQSLDILYESYQDTKYRCCPLLRKMVDAGLLGRKSKQGFYKYS